MRASDLPTPAEAAAWRELDLEVWRSPVPDLAPDPQPRRPDPPASSDDDEVLPELWLG
jgi:hypothetical protein